jgi:hypothetical protein
MQRSLVFATPAKGHALLVNFDINVYAYNKGYYLANGIYLEYATFVKTISYLALEKEAYFLQHAKKHGART